MISLTLIGAMAGVILSWIWKRFSNPEDMALAKRQTRARLYAMRLYADDPAVVFRAQRELLQWTARYLARMLRPTAVATVPLLILCLQLDSVYGHRPLAPGEAVVVTAQFGDVGPRNLVGATLEGRGMLVETPGVRIPDRRQICWRVRADREAEPTAAGSVVLHAGGAAIAKAIRCGDWRGVGTSRWIGSPSIAVACPTVTLDVFGYGIDWAWWFGLVSLVTMLALRARHTRL
jgi:hypothetical protein